MGAEIARKVALPLALAASALALAGCMGGTVTSYRLMRDAESLGSLATEGEIVAGAVPRAKTTAAYTHTHAEDLASKTEKLAEVLESATPEADVRAKTEKLIRLARQASRALELLVDEPENVAVAKRVESELSDISDAASKIEESA